MSEPLAVAALMRELVRKEITLALLDASLITAQANSNPDKIRREISKLEKDCSDLTVKFVHEAEKL